MNKIKYIIVDDELDARNGLRAMLMAQSDLELLALCSNGIEAIEKINQLQPDLLFLDIQMPKINGFEVLSSIEKQPAAVVFVTAYDQFAIKAFDVHAVDYLLKPYTAKRLQECVSKSIQIIHSKNKSLSVDARALQSTYSGTRKRDTINFLHQDKLVIKSNGSTRILNQQEIRWVEAYDYYVKIHLLDETTVLYRSTMKKMEAFLDKLIFLRIHKSSIVNLSCIVGFKPLENNQLELSLDSKIQLVVSRSYKASVLQKIKM